MAVMGFMLGQPGTRLVSNVLSIRQPSRTRHAAVETAAATIIGTSLVPG